MLRLRETTSATHKAVELGPQLRRCPAKNFAPASERFARGHDHAGAFRSAMTPASKQIRRFRVERDVADLGDNQPAGAAETNELVVRQPL